MSLHLVEQHQSAQPEQLNHEHRTETDTVTWLAETLHGSMRTAFEFRFNGYELYGEDGGALSDVFHDAIAEAQVIVAAEPSLSFELRRRLIEAGEYEEMLAMARGEGPNTMVVISDYPPELMGSSEDVGGYNGRRKQTMMRIISRQPNNNIRMVTQSLDGSNRQASEAIYARFGKKPTKHELLEHRIYTDLDPEQQEMLPDFLMDVYDESMEEQTGSKHHAGIEQQENDKQIDTYQFARDQQDLVEWFVQAKLRDPVGAERLRFKLAATAKERYMKATQHQGRYAVKQAATPQAYSPGHQVIPPLMFEIEMAGRKAAARGEVFSGCGASVSADPGSTESQLQDGAGYGNKANSDSAGSDKYGSLQFKCPKGHSNTRPRNKLIENCQTCGTSVRC